MSTIQIASVVLSAVSVVSGGSLTCTVKLNVAPTFAVVASIGADPAADVLVPATVTFAKGQQSASFAVDSKTVKATTTVTIYVNYNVTEHASFTITPSATPPTPTPIPPTPTPIPPTPGTPTFVDTFSGGSLNTKNWIVSNWTSDDYAGAGNNVTFSPSAISLSQGLLQMTLTQPTSGTSTGAELQSKTTFGFGTYQVVMRMSSTAATSTAA